MKLWHVTYYDREGTRGLVRSWHASEKDAIKQAARVRGKAVEHEVDRTACAFVNFLNEWASAV